MLNKETIELQEITEQNLSRILNPNDKYQRIADEVSEMIKEMQ